MAKKPPKQQDEKQVQGMMQRELARFLCVRDFTLSPPLKTEKPETPPEKTVFNGKVVDVLDSRTSPSSIRCGTILSLVLERENGNNFFLTILEKAVAWSCCLFRIPIEGTLVEAALTCEGGFYKEAVGDSVKVWGPGELFDVVIRAASLEIPYDAVVTLILYGRCNPIVWPVYQESSILIPKPVGIDPIRAPLEAIGNGSDMSEIMIESTLTDSDTGMVCYFMKFDPLWKGNPSPERGDQAQRAFFDNSIRELESVTGVQWRKNVVVNWGLLHFARWRALQTGCNWSGPNFREYAKRMSLGRWFDLGEEKDNEPQKVDFSPSSMYPENRPRHTPGFWDKAVADYTKWLESRTRNLGATDMTRKFMGAWPSMVDGKHGEYATEELSSLPETLRKKHTELWNRSRCK